MNNFLGGDISRVNVQLDIDARQYAQSITFHNQKIDEQIQEGIRLAIDDIVGSDTLVEAIRIGAVKELTSIIKEKVFGWEVRSRITKKIDEAIGKKIDDFAEEIAKKVTKTLEF